jgi:transcriptional regulator with XRE-family HTH domain
VKVGSQFGIGERLRAERVRRKRSIDDISRETRISPKMLEAIEREDFERLPGLLFTRNFVKQYALALGLDAEPLLAELPRVDVANSPMPQAPSRMPLELWDSSWNGAVSSVLWLILALVASVTAYVHFNRPLETRAGAKAAIPAAQAGHTAAGPAPSVPVQAGRPVSTKAPVRTVAETPPPAADLSDNRHKVKVFITAHADTWIQVSADGKTVFTGTLKPNESREISGDEMVRLLAGNAGGITISLNGRTLDPLGTSGQVKEVRLTEGGPQAALVIPNPPDDRL